MRRHVRTIAAFTALAAILAGSMCIAAETARFATHPPMRPLPVASNRPLAQGPAWYVDAAKGRDEAAGTVDAPWRTIGHALKHLKAGDTLYLRGGVYYENVACALVGTPEAPITVRSYPGEMAVIDGGFREFLEAPATAWEPVPDGAPGEFRSVKRYPGLQGRERNHATVFGNFADSMAPLHGYRFMGDLRSDNPFWTITSKGGADSFISCGPGLCYDPATERIHIRLASQQHWTFLEPERQYRGESDPRRIPLIIAGGVSGNRVELKGCRNVRLQDLVFRGCAGATMSVSDSQNVTLEGVTLFACGSTPFRVAQTQGLKIRDCAFRGIAAPWTSRAHMKYRGVEAKIFSTYITEGNRDFDIAFSEFTDACDGLFIGQVRNVDFHHNLVENFSDDGFNLSAIFDRDVIGDFGDIRIYQNRISRCLNMFVFGGRREGNKERAGAGVWIYRNVLDLRPPLFYGIPANEGEAASVMAARGALMGDHGRGLWEPVRFYHNTALFQGNNRPGDYAGGVTRGGGRSPEWRVFNNIFVQTENRLGHIIFSAGDESNLETDGNLHWSLGDQSMERAAFVRAVQSEAERIARADGHGGRSVTKTLLWARNDLVADPQFVRVSTDWREAPDLQLKPGSPAVNAGVAVPPEWPDPLRAADAEKPDLGAFPLGQPSWGVGIGGRIPVCGLSVR